MLKFSQIVAFLSVAVLSLLLYSSVVAGAPHAKSLTTSKRHNTMARRYDNAKFTYYKAGQGACGATNGDGDFIVALNSDQFDNGGYCFKNITIAYNGKSAQAQIVDRCPGCPNGGLDLSQGLFSYFASTDQGVIYGQWDLHA